jgi:hypothetical protein
MAFFWASAGGDIVLRLEDIEIGLGGADDQVLLGDLELQFGKQGLQLALLVGFEILLAIQRLLQAEAPAMRLVALVADAGDARIRFVVAQVGAHAERRAQQGLALRHLLQARLVAGIGRRVDRVVLAGELVDLGEVGGLRTPGAGHEQHSQQLHMHRGLSR